MDADFLAAAQRIPLIEERLAMVAEQQKLLLSKVDNLHTVVTSFREDVAASPVGRALQLGITANAEAIRQHAAHIGDLVAFQNEVRGAVFLLKWLGSISVLTAFGAALKAFGLIH